MTHLVRSTSFVVRVWIGIAFTVVGIAWLDAPATGDTVPATAPTATKTMVDYNRDIRPILSNNCYKCHGPDASERKAELRFDVRDDALKAAESGDRAIVPGKPAESRLIERILATDAAEIMPPPKENKKLTDAEKLLLRKWIEQGANFQTHWSFKPVQRPAIPKIPNLKSQPPNPIDAFILARLANDGLSLAPEGPKTTLIRRVTLDLTGLPPTPAEIDAFVNDRRPDAYEKLVERLFASPHHGERLAVDWLDASRYADTHGYHIDSGRDMTRWREWVIDAFQNNLPFDQFTIQQLAGDLLPESDDPQETLNRRVASGFNRNHMINFEGGAIPKEYHTAYIVDRVNTTATVWLGLSVACAQCHDHKYDPITQRDFYQLFAFFHNVPENGLDGSKGNAMPLLKVPNAAQRTKLAELAAAIAVTERKLAEPNSEIDATQVEWERVALSQPTDRWQTLTDAKVESRGGATLTRQDDGSLLASGTNPNEETYALTVKSLPNRVTAVRLELLPHDSLAGKGPGRSINGNVVLTEVRAAVHKPGAAPQPLKFREASADFSQNDFPVKDAIDGKKRSGWAIYPEVGKAHAAVFEFSEPVVLAEEAALEIEFDFHSTYGSHQPGRFRVSATTAIQPHSNQTMPEAVTKALAVEAGKRNDQQRDELRKYFRNSVSPVTKPWNDELLAKRQAREDLDKLVPTAMVMQEMPQPRDTFVLVRGQYDKPGDKVTAAVPSVFPPPPDGAPANRLGLAQWLVAPSHPLTARVTVNRYWQMFFGTGLVKTAEDFGSQGEPPSHPELLDWLAAEFMKSELRRVKSENESNDGSLHSSPFNLHSSWNLRHIIRLIVTSATYRQASVVTPALHARDPENRLLARGPRFRLQAEFIRDQALAVSGLLDRRIGGPSVSPYQPPGLWEELASRADGKNWTAQEYTQSHGPDLYRRTMYTYWKRTCPPPTLATFDAPDRETCTVRRARTNTPLQALVLWNDPTYVEASRELAERILTEGGATSGERIVFAFRLATSRVPTIREAAVLGRILDHQLAHFRGDAAAATKLLSVGESPRNEKLDAAELAAWTMVASTILNLDEVVTKG
jgi:mono/diheme cytochrome c family protein